MEMDEDGNSSAHAGVRNKNWPSTETATGSVILGAFGFFSFSSYLLASLGGSAVPGIS